MQQTSTQMQSTRALVSKLLKDQDKRGICPAHSNAGKRKVFYFDVEQESLFTQPTKKDFVVGYFKDLFLGFIFLTVVILIALLTFWSVQQTLAFVWGA